jgi:hypothetical protein
MDWITHIVALIVGMGAGWTLRIAYTSFKNVNKSNDNNYIVNQNRNKVSQGSIVGRDQSNSDH